MPIVFSAILQKKIEPYILWTRLGYFGPFATNIKRTIQDYLHITILESLQSTYYLYKYLCSTYLIRYDNFFFYRQYEILKGLAFFFQNVFFQHGGFGSGRWWWTKFLVHWLWPLNSLLPGSTLGVKVRNMKIDFNWKVEALGVRLTGQAMNTNDKNL